PDIYQQFHNEMGMATNNCLNIIDLVKKLRALEDGKLCMVLRRAALKECLDESVKVFHHKLKEKNIQIKLEVPEDTEVFVERTAFINSVINNLLSNAIKFSYPGSTILLKSEKKSERIYLSIKDWGVGIPENILSHIFSISKETTRVGTEGEVGTGFGMPLVHRFVRSFGGEIEIKSSCERESASGKSGTEVILILHSHGQGMSERE
ncbi:MAG: HAMP domain-containing histidine kinase, partial [Spirochaetota bacterium]|nr:HAMP domain-containing histidine kinase [Spirochaetota bacterium]